MLTHAQVWAALDRLAERAGLSASGLAKKSGLDPTTFNKSKRITSDGRERWPSTESIAKALAATNSSIDSFVQLIGDSARSVQSMPLLDFAQAGTSGAFDDNGLPAGKGWGETALPSAGDEHAYALEISGDAMRPVYRDGDILVISPATSIRRGDRVVVKTGDGAVTVGIEAPDRADLGVAAAGPERGRAHLDGRGSQLDRPDRVGEAISRIVRPSRAAFAGILKSTVERISLLA